MSRRRWPWAWLADQSWVFLAGAAAAAIVVCAAGAAFAVHLAGHQGNLSPACSAAVNAANYVSGRNGAQTPADDSMVVGWLTSAHWHTHREFTAAVRLAVALGPGNGGTSMVQNTLPLLKDAEALLKACQASPQH
jgi:hypothetical protein